MGNLVSKVVQLKGDDETENYNTALYGVHLHPSAVQVSKYSNIVCVDDKISFCKFGLKS